MSFIDKDTLKSFYQENSFVVKQADGLNIEDLQKQIDGEIKSKLGITAEETTTDNDPFLRNIASRLFLWYAAGKEGVTKESWDYQRRKRLYETAQEDMRKIIDGDTKVFDKDGNQISITGKNTAMFQSTKRITGIL
jgi:hypothetical protein